MYKRFIWFAFRSNIWKCQLNLTNVAWIHLTPQGLGVAFLATRFRENQILYSFLPHTHTYINIHMLPSVWAHKKIKSTAQAHWLKQYQDAETTRGSELCDVWMVLWMRARGCYEWCCFAFSIDDNSYKAAEYLLMPHRRLEFFPYRMTFIINMKYYGAMSKVSWP